MTRPQTSLSTVRDWETDYRKALIEEYNSYVVHDHLKDRAAEVAAELRRVDGGDKAPEGIQRAVDPEPLERAVPAEPKRRPAKKAV